jgi:hypothetical protein
MEAREHSFFYIGGTWKVSARCCEDDGCRAAVPTRKWQRPVMLNPNEGVCVWAGVEIGPWRMTNASES